MGGLVQGISQSEFARRDGCSKTLVQRGVKSGALVAYADGSIDPSLVGTPWRAGNRAATAVAGAPSGAGASFAEAQRIKENYLAKLRQLEFEVKSGALMDADAAKSAVFKFSREDRDALMNWPSRVSPMMAAELSCDQVVLAVTLEKYVRQYLTERSNPDLR